jgi:hypothetical protein
VRVYRYQQVLWLLNDADKGGVEDNHLQNLRITEAGAMNFFAVRRRDDGRMFTLHFLTA